MARPQRNNVDYFPHYISDGKKMFVIESKFGNDGYAVWFKVLETLAKTDNHFINCNDESNLMYLAAKCNVSEDRLIEIVDAIVKLGEIDGILWNQCRVIWSDKFIESIQDAYSRRSNNCITKMELMTMFKGLGIPKPDLSGVNDDVNPENSDTNPQSKVEYSKEKNTKEKYFEGDSLNELFHDFMEHRKQMKKKMTNKSITMMVNKLKKHKPNVAIKMLENSIENGWSGVFELKGSDKPKEYDFKNFDNVEYP
jgi:hypothetical protein